MPLLYEGSNSRPTSTPTTSLSVKVFVFVVFSWAEAFFDRHNDRVIANQFAAARLDLPPSRSSRQESRAYLPGHPIQNSPPAGRCFASLSRLTCIESSRVHTACACMTMPPIRLSAWGQLRPELWARPPALDVFLRCSAVQGSSSTRRIWAAGWPRQDRPTMPYSTPPGEEDLEYVSEELPDPKHRDPYGMNFWQSMPMQGTQRLGRSDPGALRGSGRPWIVCSSSWRRPPAPWNRPQLTRQHCGVHALGHFNMML